MANHTHGDGECEACKRKRLGLQRKQVNNQESSDVPAIVYNTLNSPGQPLDRGTRGFMESRFRHDFSQVRIHTGAQAAEAGRSVKARAFTVGNDIVFGDGQHSLHHSEGRRLLAHELTHVLQQASVTQPTAIRELSRVPVTAGRSQIQRSPLSDSVRATHAADTSLEALLARLAQSDIQSAQMDADVDAELVTSPRRDDPTICG